MLGRDVLGFLSERRLRHMAYTQAGKAAELEKLSDLCELDMEDRRELDDVVLEMLGVESAARRQELLDELYDYLREFFELTRQKEEKAIANKNKARRRGQAGPTEIAAQILAEIQESHPDLLRRYDPDFLDLSKPFDTFELPAEGIPQALRDTNPLLYDQGVVFVKGKKPWATSSPRFRNRTLSLSSWPDPGCTAWCACRMKKTNVRESWRHTATFSGNGKNAWGDMVANRTWMKKPRRKFYLH